MTNPTPSAVAKQVLREIKSMWTLVPKSFEDWLMDRMETELRQYADAKVKEALDKMGWGILQTEAHDEALEVAAKIIEGFRILDPIGAAVAIRALKSPAVQHYCCSAEGKPECDCWCHEPAAVPPKRA